MKILKPSQSRKVFEKEFFVCVFYVFLWCVSFFFVVAFVFLFFFGCFSLCFCVLVSNGFLFLCFCLFLSLFLTF